MEEILASIRRIIAEEGEGQPGKAGAGATPPASLGAAPAAAKAATAAVLDLTDFIEDDAPREGEDAAPLASLAAATAPEMAPEPPSELDAAPPVLPLALPAPAPEDKPVLLSLESEAVVSAALDEVAETLRAAKPPAPAEPGSSPLEALVLEALRPSLKSWLDQNLPDLVERLVRDEIRRLARRIEDA